jgi:probable addiction module antidote protein
MPLKTIPWDTADHLKTPADVVAYLEAVLGEGEDDPAFLVEAIGTAARAHGMSQLAADTGITRRGLYKALGENGNPSFATIYSVLRALGVRIRAEEASKAPKVRRRRAAPNLAARVTRKSPRARERSA